MALIQITDLTFTYPGSFDPVFEHVSFQLDTDWRLGLTGRNGRGKTTLLRLLQGQYPPTRARSQPPAGSSISVSHPRRGAHAARAAGVQLPGRAAVAPAAASWRRYS